MTRRADTAGGVGYGCLATLALAGGLGGAAGVFLGIARFVRARDARLESGADAAVFLGGLEGAVVLVAVGALAFLVGATAGVVLLKELGDDSAARERGPVR